MDVVRFAKYVEYILRGMEYYQETCKMLALTPHQSC